MSVHSHAAAQKSSGAFFSVWDRERCQKSAGRGRNALRASQSVHATDVMVNRLKHRLKIAYNSMKSTFYFFINNSLNLLTLFMNYDKLCRSTGARTQMH